jgi:hypothetical protein
MRKGIVFVWLFVLLLGVITLFWYNEWKFNLPTPVPKSYVAINTGTKIQLPESLKANSNKPIFLHFFNPDCPCSRFNIEHVKTLIKQYGNDASFAVILMTSKNYSEKEIQKRFDLDVMVLRDSSIAALCGVYSTPQAVIIDAQHKLFFRGNYNRSRYCTDKNSNYAQIALEALLHNNYAITMNPNAVKAYGCQLPNCKK